MNTCEAKCCQMAKASVASAISTLEGMKRVRFSEVHKILVEVCDMLRTYEACVPVTCLLNRAESAAKKIRGGECFLDRDEKGVLNMLLAEMKAFVNS